MAFRAMTGLVTEWFEPERFKVDEKTGELLEREGEFNDCTRVQIKPLSGSDYVAAFSSQSAATQLIVSCNKGVIGWDNLPDENGNPVPFDAKKINEILPGEIMEILYRRIYKISRLDQEQEKN